MGGVALMIIIAAACIVAVVAVERLANDDTNHWTED